MSKKVGRNEPCPCGSGRKYKKCCWGKAFEFIRNEEGEIGRSIPMDAEMAQVLREQEQAFKEKFGRLPGPGDPIFFDMPHPEHMEHDIVEAMRESGMPPDKVYAYVKTGRLLSEENKKFLTDLEIAEWNEAIDEYWERFGQVLAITPPFTRSELSTSTVRQLAEDDRLARYIAEYDEFLARDAGKREFHMRLVKCALGGFTTAEFGSLSLEEMSGLGPCLPAGCPRIM